MSWTWSCGCSTSNCARRRKLPWVKVEKNYVFDTTEGKQTLADLFDGRSQLIIYHFMFGPGWKEGCPGCSFLSDHIDGANLHATARTLGFDSLLRAGHFRPLRKRCGLELRRAEIAPAKSKRPWLADERIGRAIHEHV